VVVVFVVLVLVLGLVPVPGLVLVVALPVVVALVVVVALALAPVPVEGVLDELPQAASATLTSAASARIETARSGLRPWLWL
jgi:hypothetical protein